MSSAGRTTARVTGDDVPAPRWEPAPPRPARGSRRTRRSALDHLFDVGGPQIVYQPQLSLSHSVVAGYEALARFPDVPLRGPDKWFALARELGQGERLEACALERALERRAELPPGTTLAVNLSPAAITGRAVETVLPEDLHGVEIELTEHEWVTGTGPLRRRLDRLRTRGARIAIDDVGVAHSGLRRVMELAPDRVKLDRYLVRGVATSTAKAALVRAVVDLAEHIQCEVCAEGVEDVDDLETLAELDVGFAQGWLIGVPEPHFAPVDPVAVTASQESLQATLVGAPDGTLQLDSTAGVGDLVARLGAVTSLDELSALAGGFAGALGADDLLISVLTPDGTGLLALRNDHLLPDPEPVYPLRTYPLAARVMDTRAAAPVYRNTVGDPSEWDFQALIGVESSLLVPVISRGRVIGLLAGYRKDTARWSRRQIRDTRTVAAVLGPVIDVLLHS